MSVVLAWRGPSELVEDWFGVVPSSLGLVVLVMLVSEVVSLIVVEEVLVVKLTDDS